MRIRGRDLIVVLGLTAALVIAVVMVAYGLYGSRGGQG